MKYFILFSVSIFFLGLTYPNSKGIQIFRVKKSYKKLKYSVNDSCAYCFEPSIKDLKTTPIIEESDIDTFDFKNQIIKLNKSGNLKRKNLKISVYGLPVVLTLDGEILYGFWLWASDSSVGCDRVYAYNYGELKIKFGLPHYNTFGKDPRFNKKLKTYLESKN